MLRSKQQVPAAGSAAVARAPLLLLCLLALASCSAEATPEPKETRVSQVEGNQRDFDNSTVVAECLTDKGWEVEVTPGGGWGIEAAVPREQREVYLADYEACVSEAGLDNVEMTEELASEIYDNNTRVIECLEDAGFSTAEAPSRASFVNKMIENPDGDNWNPYSLVAETDLGAAISACPQ